MELLWDGGTEVAQMVLVTWPRWPPCPYMIKTWKNLLRRNQKADDLESCMHHRVLEFVQMMTLCWPWPILRQDQFGPNAFAWEKGKTMDFSETIVVYDLKLATYDRSNKKFLLTSKLCPQGAVCPLHRGYIHVWNREKNCINSDFKEISLKLAANGYIDKAFLLTSKFCPLAAVCPCPGAIYMY